MTCIHPLAARRIVIIEGRLVTDCWACAVQREVVSKIFGPAKRASIRAETGVKS